MGNRIEPGGVGLRMRLLLPRVLLVVLLLGVPAVALAEAPVGPVTVVAQGGPGVPFPDAPPARVPDGGPATGQDGPGADLESLALVGLGMLLGAGLVSLGFLLGRR